MANDRTEGLAAEASGLEAGRPVRLTYKADGLRLEALPVEEAGAVG